MRTSHIFAVAALATILAGHASAAPQEEGTLASENAEYAPVCMTREYEFEGGKRAFEIITVASDVRALEFKGFLVTDCKTVFRNTAQQERYRDEMCSRAAEFSSNAQTQFANVFGERPAVLCGTAELAVGQWEPRGNGSAAK